MTADLECRELVELATDYLEGALASDERVRLERHLAACGGCAAFLRQLRAVVRAAGRLADRSLPDGTADRLLAAFLGWRGRGRPA